MKLEAVNPLLPEEVCVATVSAVRGSYLWLQLEGECQCPEKPSGPLSSAFSVHPCNVVC